MVIKLNGFIYDLTEKDAVECLQKEINKMYAENEKLRSVENLETITENILLKNQQTQKAIECLKDVIKKLYDEFESGTFITDEGKEYYGSYVKYFLILDFVIDKLKALGLEGDDIFVDNILKELEGK